MDWHLSHRRDKRAIPIADRHYNWQKIGSPQFVPPGRCLVLLTESADALWVTSWPFPEYVRHAWAGAWICSCFRNESNILSSNLIRQAVAATRWKFPEVPELGMVTFVNPDKVRRKRDWGRCYRKAGFMPARCIKHFSKNSDCPTCQSRTHGGLVALQLLPDQMPGPEQPRPAFSRQLSLWPKEDSSPLNA